MMTEVSQDLWKESVDHRSVIFNNHTDEWLQLTGTFLMSSFHRPNSVKCTTKKILPPRQVLAWHFLGESMDSSSSEIFLMLMAFLPDSYALSVRNRFEWEIQDVVSSQEQEDFCEKGCQINALVITDDSSRLSICPKCSRSRLSIETVPPLEPRQSYHVKIVKSEASSLQSLSLFAILNMGIHQKNVQNLPLPESIKIKIKYLLGMKVSAGM